MRLGGPRCWVALTAIAVFLGSCGTQPPYLPAAGPTPTSTEPAEVRPSPTPTRSHPAPTPEPTAVERHRRLPSSALQLGSGGYWVRRLQKGLSVATYDPGPADGRFGYMTLHAVLAFQKVNALERDGIVTPAILRQILRGTHPSVEPLELSTYVDVDIGRQVLFEVREGLVTHTLPISTGSGQLYESEAGVAVAQTPRGLFEIIRKIPGWHVSYLGEMYYPSYFLNGWAIHGSESVPAYPASHGCVRIPMHSTLGFYERNPIGTPVYVHD